MGDPKDALALLAGVLEGASVAYAIIGGMAAQVWRKEPRATLDVDVAIRSYDALPREALVAAGFRKTGVHSHTENWEAPDGSPVQFADDEAFEEAIRTAVSLPLGDSFVRFVSPLELVRAKLRAHADSSRRKSKRLQDLADAEAVLEERPELRSELSAAERALLE